MRTRFSVVLVGLGADGWRHKSLNDGSALRFADEARLAGSAAPSTGFSADVSATRTIASVQTGLALGNPLESQTTAHARSTRSTRIARDWSRAVRSIASL